MGRNLAAKTNQNKKVNAMNQKAKERIDTGNRVSDTDWPARARGLSSVIAAASDRTEQDRQIPQEVMSALHDAALFRMFLPRSIGGGEADPLAFMEVLEAVSAADASTAWCLGQAIGCSSAAAFLDGDAAGEVFANPDDVLAWGPPVSSADAAAVVVDGGYRVTGKWMLVSGIRNATWLGPHCTVFEADGKPRMGAGGKPVNRTMLIPKTSAEVTDVWRVVGLKGTGSDSYTVSDLFVPEAYSFTRNSAADRRETGPLYDIPLLTMYGMGFAGVALGIARAALDDFLRLAAEKVATHTTNVLRENTVIQSRVAQAEGRLGSARAFLVEMINATWASACAAEAFPLEQRARLRIAITSAIDQASEVVDFAYRAAGTTAIFDANPFERRFRDIHTVAQQGQAHLSNLEAAGRALLGLDPASTRI